MLINTVLLFLQSGLPIFIIISLLLLRFNTLSMGFITYQNLIALSILACTLIFALSHYIESLSQLFDGKGTEVIFSLGFIIVYFCSALIFLSGHEDRFNKVKKHLSLVILLLVLLLNGSHFILYLTSYWSQSSLFESIGFESTGFESLFLGITLAVGICASIAILFYFILRYSDRVINTKTSGYFLLLFAIGQLMQSIVLLQQVDVLPMSRILWNSTNLIAENTELGQLFRVLIGYETTPSLMQLVIYLTALIVPVLISKSRYCVWLAYGEKS